MAKSGDLTDAQRERLATLLEQFRQKQPEDARDNRSLHRALHLDISTISKIKNKSKGVGINVLLRLREALQMPIEEILDLPPLGSSEILSTEIESDPWPARRDAARFARKRGIPEHVIDDVRRRYSDLVWSTRKVSWWGSQFQDAYAKELREQEEMRAAREERETLERGHREKKGRKAG